MFESIIKDHLISCLLDNGLICVQKFGFMLDISTCLQPLNVSNDLAEARESTTKVDIICLDLLKAIDTSRAFVVLKSVGMK